MAQIVITGHAERLLPRRRALSEAIHGAVVETLASPPEKRFHRFHALAPEDFLHPADRGADYTIIEISLFEGRTAQTRRALIAALFTRIQAEVGIDPHSVEITLTETPRVNWGIRGHNAEDLSLGYDVQR